VFSSIIIDIEVKNDKKVLVSKLLTENYGAALIYLSDNNSSFYDY